MKFGDFTSNDGMSNKKKNKCLTSETISTLSWLLPYTVIWAVAIINVYSLMMILKQRLEDFQHMPA